MKQVESFGLTSYNTLMEFIKSKLSYQHLSYRLFITSFKSGLQDFWEYVERSKGRLNCKTVQDIF